MPVFSNRRTTLTIVAAAAVGVACGALLHRRYHKRRPSPLDLVPSDAALILSRSDSTYSPNFTQSPSSAGPPPIMFDEDEMEEHFAKLADAEAFGMLKLDVATQLIERAQMMLEWMEVVQKQQGESDQNIKTGPRFGVSETSHSDEAPAQLHHDLVASSSTAALYSVRATLLDTRIDEVERWQLEERLTLAEVAPLLRGIHRQLHSDAITELPREQRVAVTSDLVAQIATMRRLIERLHTPARKAASFIALCEQLSETATLLGAAAISHSSGDEDTDGVEVSLSDPATAVGNTVVVRGEAEGQSPQHVAEEMVEEDVASEPSTTAASATATQTRDVSPIRDDDATRLEKSTPASADMPRTNEMVPQ